METSLSRLQPGARSATLDTVMADGGSVDSDWRRIIRLLYVCITSQIWLKTHGIFTSSSGYMHVHYRAADLRPFAGYCSKTSSADDARTLSWEQRDPKVQEGETAKTHVLTGDHAANVTDN